jgi:hypothetical protein
MKKLVLSLVIVGFVAFGAIGIKNIMASATQTEMANFDKDPKKGSEKKTTETKEVKAEAKTAEGTEKSCASSCTEKSASDKSCCAGEKSECSKSCPDKK